MVGSRGGPRGIPALPEGSKDHCCPPGLPHSPETLMNLSPAPRIPAPCLHSTHLPGMELQLNADP